MSPTAQVACEMISEPNPSHDSDLHGRLKTAQLPLECRYHLSKFRLARGPQGGRHRLPRIPHRAAPRRNVARQPVVLGGALARRARARQVGGSRGGAAGRADVQ